LVIVSAATLLVVAVGLGILLANLRAIVLSALRSSFPGFEVSLDRVSLESASRLRIKGLQLSGPRGDEGSVVRIEDVSVSYRLDLTKGVVLKTLDLSGGDVFLSPGTGSIFASLGASGSKAKPAESFPLGPSIGRISLSDSRLRFKTPDFNLECSLLGKSRSDGPLLSDTSFFLGVRDVSLDLPSVKLRDVGADLSFLVNRDHTGKTIQLSAGQLRLADLVSAEFQGSISLVEGPLSANGSLDIERLSLSDLLARLKEPFPELADYRVEGEAAARSHFRYFAGDGAPLLMLGELHLRRGHAVLPLAAPLVVEDLAADIPVQYSVKEGSSTLLLGSPEQQVTGATLSAARLLYDEEEMASDIVVSFRLRDQSLESSTASFIAHGGRITARSSGTLEEDSLALEGDVDFRTLQLGEILQRLRIQEPSAWGGVTGNASVSVSIKPTGEFHLAGDLTARVPETTVSLRNPLTVTGLEVRAPFEYSTASNVQTFGIVPTDSYPDGGTITAVRIGYGEKIAEDGTSAPKWLVSGLLASAVSDGEAIKFSIQSCQAYDGEVTGDASAVLEKKALRYEGKLHVQDLDMQRLMKGLGVKREKFYMDGLVQGDIRVAGKGGKWDAISGEFSAIPPGGIIRVEDVEKLLGSMPAGKATIESLKRNYNAQQWKALVEGLKEFRYRVATATVKYPPLEPRAGGGTGPDIRLHFEGTGAGREFDITITIPVTFQRD
jgi:hypothetical protein